jgi:hypothetical protein
MTEVSKSWRYDKSSMAAVAVAVAVTGMLLEEEEAAADAVAGFQQDMTNRTTKNIRKR